MTYLFTGWGEAFLEVFNTFFFGTLFLFLSLCITALLMMFWEFLKTHRRNRR